MNEVKGLVEELRNKKSRDNRDLLDRSVDMIERLAKKLCDESGCHHKCKEIDECVVMEEAEEIINELVPNRNELPFALTNEQKVSVKVKQIEEMTETINDLYGADAMYYGVDSYGIATALYNAGYRKQSENTVEVVKCKNCKHWKDTGYDTLTEKHWGECREPLGDYRYCETAENDFCSCGEMKGGE